MNLRPGMYHYELRGREYVIYRRNNDNASSSVVTSEPRYSSREAARRRVYALNGWKL